MIENWKDVQIVPEFCDQGVDCYRLEGGHFLNEYYIVSEAETRKLMNHPEVVGYEVYASLVTATSQMMYYLKEKKKITSANILSILRGALNYPLEESCYKEHIRVHDISFMSSERVFENGEMTGLEIKYCKLATVPNSTLLIGDIIASGETLVNCLRYVIDYYRKQGTKLRNIVLFTIGGTQGVEILEKLTQEIRVYWPGFEGFADVKQRLKNMGCSSPHTKERYPVIQGPLLLLFCCILLPDQPGNLIGEAIDDLHPHAAVYIHAVDKEQEHFIGQLVRSKRPAGHAAGLRQFTVLAL